MSKYNKSELKVMALHVQAAKKHGDLNYTVFVSLLCTFTGLTWQQCKGKIQEMADYEV